MITGGASQLVGMKDLIQTLTQRYARLGGGESDTQSHKMPLAFAVLHGLVLFMQEQDRHFLPGIWLPSFEASSFLAKIVSWFRENL